jgi:hypothetical protein
MKSNQQTASNTKAKILTGVKSTTRKAKATAKRTTRATNRLASETQSTLQGYSASAQRFIKRGKAAFGEASAWAGKTAGELPKTARNVGVPNQQAVQTFMSERPLIVGAVGLGLGVVLGSMLPSGGGKALPKRRK